MLDKIIDLVCLVMLDADGFVFAAQRPEDKSQGLHWEFPGGKVEDDEIPEDALRREIEEELSLTLGRLERMPDFEHSYDFGRIRLIPFLYHCATRPPVTLTEHRASIWLHPCNWHQLTWAPADIPIVQHLCNLKGTI